MAHDTPKGHDKPKSVTHKDDLEFLFPDNLILMNRQYVFVFGVVFYILDVFEVVFHHTFF